MQLQSVSDILCASRSTETLSCLMQERLASLPEGFSPLQDPSRPLPDSNQLQGLERQTLERQGLERQSLERQLAQTEAALKAEQLQCDALRKQAQQSKGCAMQAQVQLRRSHSRAERLAALVNEADQARRRCDACLLFCTTPPFSPCCTDAEHASFTCTSHPVLVAMLLDHGGACAMPESGQQRRKNTV